MKTTAAWVLWLLASMLFLLSTRNPVYLLSTILLLYLLGARLTKPKQPTAWVKQNLRFLLTMITLSTLINALFTHTGQTVLFNLPEGWPLIGGDVTLESLFYGAINGLVISALYLLFNIFNLALSIKQITRLIPRAFHPLATMVTISLTFFPSIQQRTREIREAQLIRGNPMKKVSDWLPILVPLLVSSLEDAFLLSESMTARGFHTQSGATGSSLNLIALILAAFAVFSGWILHLYDYPLPLSLGLYGLGAVLIMVVLVASGKQNPITSLEREPWRPADITAGVLLSLALVSTLVLLFTNNTPTLSYTPYPALTLPNLHWTGALLSLIPGIPLILAQHD